MKRTALLLSFLVACTLPATAATVIDISQQSFTGFYDYGNNTGQTFTPLQKGSLEGISLNIDRHGNGADVILTLYTLNGEQNGLKSVVATSTVMAANFSSESSWIYFTLDKAYTLLAAQKLAFTVSQPQSSASGFVSFASSDANPYAGGTMTSGTSTLTPKASSDLAFQTHLTLVPEPSSAVLLLGGLLLLGHRKRDK